MSFLLSNLLGACLAAGMVLTVLKTIGFVALIVLCVVIILVLCVLFVPIRYHVRGDVDEMNFDARLHWFLKIIMFRLVYKDGSADYALYLFGLRTRFLDKDFLDKWKRRREKRKAKKAVKAHGKRKKKYQKEHDKYKEQYLKDNPEMAQQTEQSVEHFSNEKSGNKDTESSTSKNKVMDVLKKVLHVIQVIRDYQPLQMIWSDLQKLMHHARPRKMNGDILFGFEDPALTGQALALISNVYFIYQYEDLHINGDFETEESYIKGDFDIRGYLQSVFGLVFILKVIKKKRFRRFLKALNL